MSQPEKNAQNLYEESIRYLELATQQKHPKAAEALETVMMTAYRPNR